MINRRGQNGFTMIVVLCLVALAGVAMVLLTKGSNILLFDLQRTQYHSTRRNLTASALAWAEVNADKIPHGGKQLSLDGAAAPDAALRVIVEGDKPEIRIRTTCRYGRKLIKKDSRHTLRRKP